MKNRFGERLARERDGRGWSQATMAEKLSEHGFPCHATAVAKLEANERSLSAEELGAFAGAFGCSADALLGRDTRPGADREFVLRRLQISLDDAARTVRVALRDVADRIAEADNGGDAELIASIRAVVDQLDADALELAQCCGLVAERRAADQPAVRVQRIKYSAKRQSNA